MKWLEVFSVGRLQDFLTIKRLMEEHGTDLREIEDYVAQRKPKAPHVKSRFTLNQMRWKNKAPRCPLCGATLLLRRIILAPGRGNKNGYRSEWYCAAGDCIYERYSTMTVEEQIKRYGLDEA